jgi:hypothetical protein
VYDKTIVTSTDYTESNDVAIMQLLRIFVDDIDARDLPLGHRRRDKPGTPLDWFPTSMLPSFSLHPIHGLSCCLVIDR